MSCVEVRDLGEPETVVSYPLGTSNHVRLAQTMITRHSFSQVGAGRSMPGRWSEPPGGS
jgi:hypothetical protein